MSLMTQWEYCELRWQASSRYETARPSVVFYRDPSKAWSPPDANPEQLALRLGMEGWELVSIVTYDRSAATGTWLRQTETARETERRMAVN